jgi:hypothetical protein
MVLIVMQIIAWIITPLLPAFAVLRDGPINNNRTTGMASRLPLWLSWFDTPDNGLEGDENFHSSHPGNYWSEVLWLYRNSLYGFKWTVLSMPIENQWQIMGSMDIDYHIPVFGFLSIRQPNGAWQWKCVKPLFGKIFVGNFGWLLDDRFQKNALFMFSPRLK